MSTSRTLKSERVVIAAPMSFSGSQQRIWRITTRRSGVGVALFGFLAVALIICAWTAVLGWYCMWGLWLVPYRMIRRGSRKRKREARMHRETLAAIKASRH